MVAQSSRLYRDVRSMQKHSTLIDEINLLFINIVQLYAWNLPISPYKKTELFYLHSVLIIGYGKDYILIKNSCGNRWRQDVCAKIARGIIYNACYIK